MGTLPTNPSGSWIWAFIHVLHCVERESEGKRGGGRYALCVHCVILLLLPHITPFRFQNTSFKHTEMACSIRSVYMYMYMYIDIVLARFHVFLFEFSCT